LVSHDRAFLENTVTQVIAFEGNGVLTEFGGGYDDWQRFSTQQKQKIPALQANIHAPSGAVKSSTPDAEKAVKQTTKQAKLSFKEQKELDEIPARIEQLEVEQANIHAQLADGEFYKTQPERVKTLQSRLTEIDSLLENHLARWEELDSRQK